MILLVTGCVNMASDNSSEVSGLNIVSLSLSQVRLKTDIGTREYQLDINDIDLLLEGFH
jgi:hypothetical protein